MISEGFTIVYDLAQDGAWERACYDRATWGKLYTDAHWLDDSHVALVFRPAGEKWATWEAVRQGWILEGEVA